MLGNRKRETVVARRQAVEIENANPKSVGHALMDDVFRKHFEATFDPILDSTMSASIAERAEEDGKQGNQSDGSEGDTNSVSSSWSGISEDEPQASEVQVVEHTTTLQAADNDTIDKIFQKSFMSSRPPLRIDDTASKAQITRVKHDGDDEEENTNLRHDLDLQRLLQESHLLEQSKRNATPGTHRHKATDMRLQSLGSKTSIFMQEKMPMSHRKGIIAKASSREVLRRKEARDNGVILEKPTSKKRHVRDNSRRDRGVDAPGVGKFKGGTLQLSRKDVASIQGPHRTGTNKKQKKKNGRR